MAWSTLALPAVATPTLEDTSDPFLFDEPQLKAQPESGDLETLLDEAQELFLQKKPIDARSKLLSALAKAPQDFRPHMMLGGYYLGEVGHFRMAYKYLRTAEDLFQKKYGKEPGGSQDQEVWRQHARLLYLLSEARLNLDRYQDALDTLDQFALRYWDDWYPGTRAWVLMKLKRVDEAINVAQTGLLAGAEPGRTYNILGILLSLKDNRKLALEAFNLSLRAELAMGSFGQPATPLNNSGEVYRELFSDDYAEASWLQSTRMPDGCDHILPSLNLTLLYIDELRLFQAERTLDDFVACYSANSSLRSDTEHRALLALARGKIALRRGDTEKALEYLSHALEREQWFGKIGTNENDLRFAATITLAQALKARAKAIQDISYSSLAESLRAQAEIPVLKLRAWWHNRRAREIALSELNDFEDLVVRNTDTMIEYPTLGSVIEGFPRRAFDTRSERMLSQDRRTDAHAYYHLWRASNELNNGRNRQALAELDLAKPRIRDIDRLLKAEFLAQTVRALRAEQGVIWSSLSEEEESRMPVLINELFSILPSHVRYYDFALPVIFESSGDINDTDLSKAVRVLFDGRFEKVDSGANYSLTAGVRSSDAKKELTIALRRISDGKVIAQISGPVGDRAERTKIINSFLNIAFSHKVDPPATPVPKLEVLESVFNREQ